MWLRKGGIANILSLTRASNIYHVTIYGGKFTTKRYGGNHFFQDQENGLLILGVKELEKGKYMVLINTVAGEAERFSCRAQYGAALDNREYGVMWFPSRSEFTNMLCSELISNCTITPDDVTVVNKIYGHYLHYIRGKIARRQMDPVLTDYIDVLLGIINDHV